MLRLIHVKFNRSIDCNSVWKMLHIFCGEIYILVCSSAFQCIDLLNDTYDFCWLIWNEIIVIIFTWLTWPIQVNEVTRRSLKQNRSWLESGWKIVIQLYMHLQVHYWTCKKWKVWMNFDFWIRFLEYLDYCTDYCWIGWAYQNKIYLSY